MNIGKKRNIGISLGIIIIAMLSDFSGIAEFILNRVEKIGNRSDMAKALKLTFPLDPDSSLNIEDELCIMYPLFGPPTLCSFRITVENTSYTTLHNVRLVVMIEDSLAKFFHMPGDMHTTGFNKAEDVIYSENRDVSTIGWHVGDLHPLEKVDFRDDFLWDISQMTDLSYESPVLSSMKLKATSEDCLPAHAEIRMIGCPVVLTETGFNTIVVVQDSLMLVPDIMISYDPWLIEYNRQIVALPRDKNKDIWWFCAADLRLTDGSYTAKFP